MIYQKKNKETKKEKHKTKKTDCGAISASVVSRGRKSKGSIF